MTVGDYYIAEKTVNDEGTLIYKLLNNDIMDRKGTEPIRVYRCVNGVDRFAEYEIKGWIEENNLEHATDVNLCPLITVTGRVYGFINPLTDGVKRVLDKSHSVWHVGMSVDIYKKNLQGRPGYQVLSDNTFGKVDTTCDVFKDVRHNNSPLSDMLKQNYSTLKAGHRIMVNSVYGRSYGNDPSTFDHNTYISDSDDERERRINHDNAPIQRHVCDESIGLNVEYLLIK